MLALCQGAAGVQVFLTELTLFSASHRLRIEGGLTIYMRCDNTDINLPEVKETGRQYAWAAEDKPLTTLTRGGCKTCGVFEDRRIPFIDDNVYGAPWALCEADFEASPSHDLRVSAAGQFSVTLHCPECAPPSPLPPPPALPPALPPAAAPAPAASWPAHSPIMAASDESALVRGGGNDGGAGGARALPLSAVVGIAAAVAAVSGVAAGVALAMHCRRRRVRLAEERQRAFEAVFSDPELELEEVAAEDAKLFSWSRLGPRWARLRDTSVSTTF
ncbi:hypothetical protein WJX81_003093 [Elliptochloris bilobata]|uniref:DUF7953 domain-containing protein n=1 Tax=Elliptochloris bilobata TaxID=381761 RepID=A0AAW1S5R8_9CHLO